jgi:hypothetical protein
VPRADRRDPPSAAAQGRADDPPRPVFPLETTGESAMRPVLLWVLGIPIPVIILLYVFHVI